MNRDRLRGKTEQIKDKTKTAGEVTDDERLIVEEIGQKMKR